LSEYLVSIKIEKLDEGVYLATSDTLQGLVAQGRTIAETNGNCAGCGQEAH
jgi:antitoxin HicB